MKTHIWIIVALVACAAIAIRPVRAQESAPEPGTEASRFLPDASALGDGWSLSQTVSPDVIARYYFEMSPDVFREGAAGIYLGPDGSRVVAVALLITESRVAIRQSWEDASAILVAFRSDLQVDYDREQALESMDPPDGCVEAKRTEGTTTFYLLPAGVTLCAADPDIVLLAAISGTFGGTFGVEASDQVVQAMVDSGLGAIESTPEA